MKRGARRALYWLSWAVLGAVLVLTLIGSMRQHGIGPLILALVVGLALIGVQTLGD